MRLLLDECIDERLRLLFAGHDCQTARFADLAGLKNGHLLEAAEAGGFEVLITVDQANRLRDLAPLVPAALSTLGSIGPGDLVRIG